MKKMLTVAIAIAVATALGIGAAVATVRGGGPTVRTEGTENFEPNALRPDKSRGARERRREGKSVAANRRPRRRGHAHRNGESP